MWIPGVNAALAGGLCFVAGGLAAFAVLRPRARGALPAPARVFAMELHAVFNVLNRLAMIVPHEHDQDAIDRLAQYLRAHHRFTREVHIGDRTAVEEAIGSYWRMTRWLAGDPGDQGSAIEWDWQAGALDFAGNSPVLAQAIERSLRRFEGVAVASLHISVGIEQAGGTVQARASLRHELASKGSNAGQRAIAGSPGPDTGCNESLLRIPLGIP